MKTEELKHAFYTTFGEEADALFFSPGRINLIGEHTDYNGGHVFPAAITLGTYGAAKKRSDRTLRFYSANFEEAGIIEVSLDHLTFDKADSWTNYAKGVLKFLQEAGHRIDSGMDVFIYGNIPNGSGLSSSASLELLIGIIAEELFDLEVTRLDLVKIGKQTENDFIGVNSGIMDQFASAMGKKNHAIFLDTNSLDFEWVPVNLGNYKLIITNSMVKHSLVSSAYNDRRRECEKGLLMLQRALNISALGDLTDLQFEANKYLIDDEVIQKRVHHAVSENQRTIAAVSALKENDILAFGELMNASHRSLRDDYEVSCPEVDTLVETAWKLPFVAGSRITGGGFGGCTVSLVASDKTEDFKAALSEVYKKNYDKIPEFYIAEISDGARAL